MDGTSETQAAVVKKSDSASDVDAEVKVLTACSKQLSQLPSEAATRVLLYLTRRFAEQPPMQTTQWPSRSHEPTE